VTALAPVIGYHDAAHIAEQATRNGSTLREAALASGRIDAADYDRIVVAANMVGDGLAGA
jgi:fumarate hydratase class II